MTDYIFDREKFPCFVLYLLAIISPYYINVGYDSATSVWASPSNDSRDNLDFKVNQSLQNNSESNEQIPSNITVHLEPKNAGTLYLSALIADGDVKFTRDLDDELFPFQTINWYQLIKFTPNYTETLENQNLKFDKLIVGQLQDFDNFDELLNQARIYLDVPVNETFVLDLPNKEVSFMQLQIPFSNDTSAVYYGLYDGNQQGDKSEVNLRLNPESSLKILDSDSAINIKNDKQLYNITSTLVCNDIYKLGYERCR